MNLSVLTAQNTQHAPLTASDAEAIADALKASRSRNTQRMYAAHQGEFDEWLTWKCYPLTPEATAAFLKALDDAGAKTSTIQAKLAAIAAKYPETANHQAVRMVFKGIKRQRADRMIDQDSDGVRGNVSESKQALSLDALRQICQRRPQGLTEERDRAMILVGYWGGFRRSELVALNVEDIKITHEGLLVRVVRGKTDQEGEGMTKPVASTEDKRIDPVVALRAWLEATGLKSGPLFVGTTRYGKITGKRLTAQVVALIVKREAATAGIDAESLAGHSLRSGFVTTTRSIGVDDKHIREVTGHKTNKMLDHYDKRGAREAMQAIRRAMRSSAAQPQEA